MYRIHLLTALAVVALGAAGCELPDEAPASTADASPPDPPDSQPPPDTGPDPIGDPDPIDDPDPIEDPDPVVEPTCPIPPRTRRLNRREYINTVRDLFPMIEVPSVEIAPDPSPELFDNDANALVPSSLLIDQYASAALEIVATLEPHLDALVPCDHADPWCPRETLDTLGKRIFRRPLTDPEHEFLLGLMLTWGDGDFLLGVEAVIQAMLQSPGFLYRLEEPSPCQPLTPWQTATRLSYALWASTPDALLLEDAESGVLATQFGVDRAVRRMVLDDRYAAVFEDFFRQWMNLEALARATKPPEADFGDAARDSYAGETERFVRALFDRRGTLRDLLTARLAFVDAPLAELYGVDFDARSPIIEVQLPENRPGFLTRAAFLAGHAHPNETAPILRGLFVLERLLCIELGPPPPGVQNQQPAPNDPNAPRTNRDAWHALTANQPCAGCHDLMNPLGFALESYDTLGAWQRTDNGLPVDTRGTLPDGTPFADAIELTTLLAADPTVSACYTDAWLRYLIGDREAVDETLAAHAHRAFVDSGLDLHTLIVAIVSHPRFARGVPAEDEGIPTEEAAR